MVGRKEPSPGLLRRLDDMARAAFPATGTVLLMVLAAGPSGVPALVPAVTLPCVIFWSIFRPGAMPPPAVFLLGLLQDLLTLAALGTGVVTLLVAHGVAVAWRRFLVRQSFMFVWLAFCAFAVGTAALGWVLTALMAWNPPGIAPALHQAGLTAGLYPAFAFVLSRIHGVMRRAEETT
ncbi:rod shape-determining protein MreD [Falsiroseomonas selenitidurans]|uniref:Rod shape-determining protein MreD n=1 Tax=Falsiroseomonas selenitidurans TaxID=2716335 RepID=A0ABX1EDS3_9PROT|nr:rod shape-determining protein MreD [Falsiroseomonas selenitidurans]NKC33040.1 rod shape-determining protein MreD [Falsiroseomonas selenitidurans]